MGWLWDEFYRLFMSVPYTWGQALLFWILLYLSVRWIDKKNYHPNCRCKDPRASKPLEDSNAVESQEQ